MTTLLEELRHHTRAQHEHLERSLDVVRRLGSRNGRILLLRGFFAVYEPAERALLPFLASVEGLEYCKRCKTPALRRDLQALGLSAEDCSQIDRASPPHLRGQSHALGFAYVLEGASLGGRVIRKHLERAGTPIHELHFFNFYGDHTGARWREFCDVLQAACSDQQAAISGAHDGFAFVSAGLLSCTSV